MPPELDSKVLRRVAEILASKLIAGDESSIVKMCFATLTRESKRKSDEISTILHSIYEQGG